MTKRLSLAIASMHTFAHDVSHNQTLILELAKNAHQKNASLLLLPELCLSGYGVEDLFFSDEYLLSLIPRLIEIANNLPKHLLVTVGVPLLFEGRRYNAVALLKHKTICGIVCKQHLALSGIHYEPRWFQPWPKGKKISLEIGNQTVPLGDICFEVDGIRLGFEICEDAWVEARPAMSHFENGVDIILNPSASHFAIGKENLREEMVTTSSKRFDCLYLYSNLLGCETGRALYDGVNLASDRGVPLLKTEAFSFKESTLAIVTHDVTTKGGDKKNLEAIAFTWPNETSTLTKPLIAKKAHENQHICLAIARGLWDWQQKTKTTGFVVSLSGGADSALTASLVYLAHAIAQASLGIEAYLDALKSCGVELSKIDKDKSLLPQVMPLCLVTAYQGSKHSSQTTYDAANALAQEIGSSHENWTIDEIVERYVAQAQKRYQKTLSFKEHDIALQNIQARVRAPSVWLLANIENKLLLATSNLSEAVVGYCTMDGDTSGVLAPIGGVSKTRVLALNAFLMEKGISFNNITFKLPSLKHIVKQTPTAELRPETQTDEADLMPYEVLDAIRQYAQVDFLTEEGIARRLKDTPFKETYTDEQLRQWQSLYFKLYYRNQWKRERLAPSFHIEVDSACPKTYRRFPII